MARLRKGSRVRHAAYPERVGQVLRIGQQWHPDERRWESSAEVLWDGDYEHWILVRDLVLVKRAGRSEEGR